MRHKHAWGAIMATVGLFGLIMATILVPTDEVSTKQGTLLTVGAPETTALVSTVPTVPPTEPPTTTAPPAPTTQRTTTTLRASRGVVRTTLPTTTVAPETTTTAQPEPEDIPAEEVPVEETTTTTEPPEAPYRTYEASWYGPGFYGNSTACGQRYSEHIHGTAHKTLPCGTMVTFRYNGVTKTVPVIDRGPYTAGRTWDLSRATCVALNHCHTGPLEARY